jgi:Spy/CpxP family protein refolding chaperone
MNRRTFWMVALGLAMLVPASSSFAQERQGRNGDRGGDRGGFGDPAQFREMMMNRIKERLEAKDDEWQVLQPKIDKLMTAQREQMAGRFGGFGRSRGGERGGDQPSTPVASAARELESALENKETSPDSIAAKLAALREARAKAKAGLETAQKDLKEVLTPRQEAVMVSMGMLE